MRRLRVLHVLRTPVGGLFRHVLDLARGQVVRGHEVGIVCDSRTGGERADAALAAIAGDLSLGIHRVPMQRVPHPADAAALIALTRIYRDRAPDVLHGHGSKGGVYARAVTWPACDRTTIRAYTPHGGSFHFEPGSLQHRLYMTIERWLDRRTDVFLFESAYVQGRFETFIGATRKTARVVHNGIDDREFDPLHRAADPFDLVYIGELRELKGVDTLIDALALIRRQAGKRLTLLCVGAGDSEGALMARAKAAGVWDSIAFVPPQPIREAIARGRIMVVPSRAESLPYVILEAAAAAQPLIATNVGGIPEIFGPYADELIPASDPEILARKITDTLGQSEETRGLRARSLSRHVHAGFGMDGMIDGVLGGYEEALAARGLLETPAEA